MGYKDTSGSVNIPDAPAEEINLKMKDEKLTISTPEGWVSLTKIQTRVLHVLLDMSLEKGELDGQED